MEDIEHHLGFNEEDLKGYAKGLEEIADGKAKEGLVSVTADVATDI